MDQGEVDVTETEEPSEAQESIETKDFRKQKQILNFPRPNCKIANGRKCNIKD